MALEIPDSMDSLAYFSRRKLGDKGKIVAWVDKMHCEKCKKGLMSKPLDEKTKKIKIRAKEYVCQECGHTESKKEHEDKLQAKIIYQCPFCTHEGEAVVLFQRKSFYGSKATVFPCGSCKEKLGVTKKLATPEKFLNKIHQTS